MQAKKIVQNYLRLKLMGIDQDTNKAGWTAAQTKRFENEIQATKVKFDSTIALLDQKISDAYQEDHKSEQAASDVNITPASA